MRKVALILILSFVLATPVLAASQEASQAQAQAWDKVVLDYYEGKYGASEDYKNDYVTIDDWTIIDVDSSKLEAAAQEEIAKKEQELTEIEKQVSDLQEQLDYFKSLSGSMEDKDYKEQIEPVVKDTERSLKDAQKEAEGKQNEIKDLQEQEYFDQIAVTNVAIKFGGKLFGTMTHRETQFINPEDGKTIDSATAKQYDAVSEFVDQHKVEQQTFHHDTVGLFFLGLGLVGWLVVTRKF